jgi:hypothetical protein
MTTPDRDELLTRIDERVEAMQEKLLKIPALCSEHNARLKSVEESVRSIWGRHWWIVGIGMSTLLTLIGALVVKFL